MKKLLISIVITAALFFVFDRCVGFGLKELYKRANTTDEYKVSYSCEMTTAPVLFMGSSRCLHHYIPAIFEDSLGLQCYNAGNWGIKNIYYHYGLLSNILTRYIPKAIILEIHPSEWLALPFSGSERAGSLAPYCGMSEGCDEMLKLSGKYWQYRLSTVYRYTGSLPSLLTGKFGSMDRSLKGWKPLYGEIDTVGVKAEEYPFDRDHQRIELLEKFMDLCKAKDIQLIIAVSPMYACSQQDVFEFPRLLAKKHNIPFIEHYRDTAFVGKQQLFYDFGHLNKTGAEKYSRLLSKELKAIIH